MTVEEILSGHLAQIRADEEANLDRSQLHADRASWLGEYADGVQKAILDLRDLVGKLGPIPGQVTSPQPSPQQPVRAVLPERQQGPAEAEDGIHASPAVPVPLQTDNTRPEPVHPGEGASGQ